MSTAARFTVLDHPADVRLGLWAPDAPALYTVAVAGLAAVLTDGAVPTDVVAEPEVRLQGVDPPDLLVQLLNECLYRLEVDGLLAVGLFVSRAEADCLEGSLRLARPGPEQAAALLEVKAATYADLVFEPHPDGGLQAELTLDL